MPVFIRPIVPTSNKKQYVIAPDGTLLDVGLIPISTDAKNAITVDDTGICVKAESLISKIPDNLLSVGVDGGLFISGTISPKISSEDYNYARIGKDGGLFIGGNDILSNGAVNLLTIDPTDHKIVLTKEAIIAALERASHDEGNLIVPGTDGGCYLSVDNLLGKNNDILHGDDAGKLVADLSLRYNLGTGKLDVIGYDGSTVVSSVTVPTSTSSLRGAYLADGKPSASGEDVTGDYFVSIAMQYDGLYDSGAFLKFRTHKSVPSEVEFEYTVDEEHSGVWPSFIKASFVGDNKVAEVSQERATTIAFSDGSILSITWTGISGTRISGTATFTPAVGIESGSYIRMVYLLDNGDVADVYVDVTELVDVYVQGDGITISEHMISVKTKPDGGITVDSTGVSVDTNWFSQQLGSTLTAGNGISIADNTVSVKPKTNGGLSVDSSGVSVSVGDGINISDTGAIIAKLQQDGGLAIKSGTGEIYVDFSLLPADMLREIVLSMVQEGGGLAVDEKGQIYVDFASMPTDKFEAMLKSIRVPIWLSKNLTMYVSTTGSDTLDEGRGLSESKPFRTLDAALSYVADNYNLSSYRVIIKIAEGNYVVDNKITNLPFYNTGTGFIRIEGADEDFTKTVINGLRITNTSLYEFANLTVKHKSHTDTRSGRYVVSFEKGNVNFFNCAIDSTELTGAGLEIPCYIIGGATMGIPASSGNPTGIHFYTKETQSELLRCDQGKIFVNADITIETPVTVAIATVSARNAGVFSMGEAVSGVNPGRAPIFSGTVTGKRYNAITNSIIDVDGAGPDAIPGTVEGDVSSGGQYV